MPNKTLYLSDEAVVALDGLRSMSEYVSETVVTRYRAFQEARARLRERFSEAEIMAVIDATNGLWITEGIDISCQVAANVEDQDEGWAEKWEVDRASILESLSPMASADDYMWDEATGRYVLKTMSSGTEHEQLARDFITVRNEYFAGRSI